MIPSAAEGDTRGDTVLTLKAPEDLVAELEALARERGVTRHAAALEAKIGRAHV